jgi:hypothetical protein
MNLNLLLALGASALLFAGSTAAQDAPPPTETPATVEAPAAPAPRIATGVMVNVVTTEDLKVADAKVGDQVGLALTAPLMLGDREILPAGTKGVAEVTSAGSSGKAGQLKEVYITVRSLDAGGVTIPLRGLQLGVRGGPDVVMKAGLTGDASLAADLVISPDGLQVVEDAQFAQLKASIIAPLPGKGRIVFYREGADRADLYPVDLRSGDDFGTKLGALTGGRYLVVDLDPGVHLFSNLKENGETIRIEVEAGETYFIRGEARGRSASPPTSIAASDRAAFFSALDFLRPAKTRR